MTRSDALVLKQFDQVYSRRDKRDTVWRTDQVMNVEQVAETGDVLVETRMNGWVLCDDVMFEPPTVAPVEDAVPDFPTGTVGPTVEVIDQPTPPAQGDEPFAGGGGESGGGGAEASWDTSTTTTSLESTPTADPSAPEAA